MAYLAANIPQHLLFGSMVSAPATPCHALPSHTHGPTLAALRARHVPDGALPSCRSGGQAQDRGEGCRFAVARRRQVGMAKGLIRGPSTRSQGPRSIIPISPPLTPLPSLARLADHPPSTECRRRENPGLCAHWAREQRAAALPLLRLSARASSAGFVWFAFALWFELAHG